jgi:hypothetical protein
MLRFLSCSTVVEPIIYEGSMVLSGDQLGNIVIDASIAITGTLHVIANNVDIRSDITALNLHIIATGDICHTSGSIVTQQELHIVNNGGVISLLQSQSAKDGFQGCKKMS